MNSGKEIIRQKIHNERLNFDRNEVTEKNKIITKKLLNLVDWATIKSLHIYSSVEAWNEVDTTQIIDNIKKNWPDITIFNRPAKKDEPFPKEQFDLIIVPVLGFDQDKYRLGLGGGWYDRFLAERKAARTIGLAYSFALLDNLPQESHDIPLQQIVTEVDIIA